MFKEEKKANAHHNHASPASLPLATQKRRLTIIQMPSSGGAPRSRNSRRMAYSLFQHLLLWRADLDRPPRDQTCMRERRSKSACK